MPPARNNSIVRTCALPLPPHSVCSAPQLVRNLCAEAVRRLRVTEAAAVQMLRSLRSEGAEQQHRIRFVKQHPAPC